MKINKILPAALPKKNSASQSPIQSTYTLRRAEATIIYMDYNTQYTDGARWLCMMKHLYIRTHRGFSTFLII